VIRTRIKDALRASIDTEDEALARRSPAPATRRKASVKATVKQVAADAPQSAGPVSAAKPIELILSTEEAEALKRARARLRDAGHTLGKTEVLRLAVQLLALAETDTLNDLASRLPTVKPPKT